MQADGALQGAAVAQTACARMVAGLAVRFLNAPCHWLPSIGIEDEGGDKPDT